VIRRRILLFFLACLLRVCLERHIGRLPCGAFRCASARFRVREVKGLDFPSRFNTGLDVTVGVGRIRSSSSSSVSRMMQYNQCLRSRRSAVDDGRFGQVATAV
jgi:hypothetical protein